MPIWILGSSLFGAQLAAPLGLPFAFASHFAPAQLMDALAIYRERFRPSEQLARPYVMLGVNVFAADTDEEARLLATSMQQAFVNLRSGRPGRLPPPVRDFEERLSPARRGRCSTRCWRAPRSARPRRCAAALHAFVARTGADELMISADDLRPRGAAALLRDRRRPPRKNFFFFFFFKKKKSVIAPASSLPYRRRP